MPQTTKSNHPKHIEKNLEVGHRSQGSCTTVVVWSCLVWSVAIRNPYGLLYGSIRMHDLYGLLLYNLLAVRSLCLLCLSLSFVFGLLPEYLLLHLLCQKFSLSHFFLRLCRNAIVSSPPIDLSFITLCKAKTLISISLHKVN